MITQRDQPRLFEPETETMPANDHGAARALGQALTLELQTKKASGTVHGPLFDDQPDLFTEAQPIQPLWKNTAHPGPRNYECTNVVYAISPTEPKYYGEWKQTTEQFPASMSMLWREGDTQYIGWL